MNCKVKSMADGTTGEAPIQEGKVDKVCKEWLVKEDGVLAYRLQNQEIEEHYEGNRQKSKIGRLDLHKAKSLQDEEHRRAYEEALLRQQAEDERIAFEIQQRLIEEEKMLERIRLEDERLAQKLQTKEKERLLKKRRERELQQVEKLRQAAQQRIAEQYNVTQAMDNLRLNEDHIGDVDLSDFCRKPPPGLSNEEMREFLAEQDAEIAEFLQRQEAKSKDTREKVSVIEAQDFEIARLLQEEEKARLKRLKEKARQKQMRKPSSEDILRTEVQETEASMNPPHHLEEDEPISNTLPKRALPPIPTTYNIFSDIDPTCKRNRNDTGSLNENGVYFAQPCQVFSDSPSISPTSSLRSRTLAAEAFASGTFIPVQGQKRSPPTTKNKSKRNKDGCKTQ